MTFLDLYNEVVSLLFPEGQGENLVDSHKRFVNDALYDLSKNVPCFSFGNVNVWHSCSTYFNCGMTVLPAPRGRILKVYTIGKKSSASTSAGQVGVPVVIAAGDVIGEKLFSNVPLGKWSPSGGPPLLQADPVTGDVCVVPLDGDYAITVFQSSPFPQFWPINSQQYFTTKISYTDTNGILQTIQPTPDLHMDVASNTGYLVVSVKKGTTISAVITPFNSPATDGGINVDVRVVANEDISSAPPTAIPTMSDDWCSKVFYEQVEYCHMEEYVRLSRNCGTPNSIFSSALVQGLFGCGWRNKRRYPCPTDAGFETLPSLPQGFHYPQASTDAGGRSRGGVWALYRGRIYIAPWIESDETVVVEWNGIKDKWSDNDLVDDDSKFRKAVRLNVAVQHFTHYEQDQQKLVVLETQWREALRDLIHECREQNRIRACGEAGGSGASARGLGSGDVTTALYYNEELPDYTASCQGGLVGTPVTVPIPANQVGSSKSVADANAMALANAIRDAESRLSCSVAPTIFYNVETYGHASCPGASGDTPKADGNDVMVTIPGINSNPPNPQFSSTLPNGQDVANAAAQAEADRRAALQLVCTFHNAPKSATGSCPENTAGADQTATVLASDPDCDSTSQVAADALAQTKANNLLETMLQTACVGIPTYLIGNEAKSYTVTRIFHCPPLYSNVHGNPNFTYTSIIPANWKTKLVTAATEVAERLLLNQQAQAAAVADANDQADIAQNMFEDGCRKSGPWSGPTGT